MLVGALRSYLRVGRHPVDVQCLLQERPVEHRRRDPTTDTAQRNDAFEDVRRTCRLSGEQQFRATESLTARLVNEPGALVEDILSGRDAQPVDALLDEQNLSEPNLMSSRSIHFVPA